LQFTSHLTVIAAAQANLPTTNMVKAVTGLLVGISVVNATGVQSRINPIRKVVNMLQMMQNKVIAEGKKKGGAF